jgi:hypothetical protein
VGDEEQRAVEHAQRPFQLLDRGQVEVVRRLVEHEAARPARGLQRELGTRPLAGREAAGGAHHMLRVEVELGQQRSRIPLAEGRFRAERPDQRLFLREQ